MLNREQKEIDSKCKIILTDSQFQSELVTSPFESNETYGEDNEYSSFDITHNKVIVISRI